MRQRSLLESLVYYVPFTSILSLRARHLMKTSIYAAVVVIGNEILSGRTHDKNIPFLATELNHLGIQLREVRIIPDQENTIIETLHFLRPKFDYIFTTGGIGPTHDDITSLAVAKAFNVSLLRHPEALRRLQIHYQDSELNEARLKMANIPESAQLIDNPVSAAPGFYIGNIYVMAGVPRIMQAMFDSIKHTLIGGAPMQSKAISLYLTEGVIAKGLGDIQQRFQQVEIGSYPFIRNGRLGTSLVLRCQNTQDLEEAYQVLFSWLNTLGGEFADETEPL